MNKPLLSVVIPVKNMKNLITKTLYALEKQQPGINMEIIVIDDGSTDGTAEYINQLKLSDVKVISQPNKGPAAARNRGIQEAKADIIAFLDADVIPHSDWAKLILEKFESDPSIAGVEGCTICPDFDDIDPYSHFMRNMEGGNYPTCNIAYSKAWLERVDGFDERYRLPWREDSDLAFSIIGAGGEIRFVKDAVVEHPVLPGNAWRVCITYSLRRQYDILLKCRHPHFYREKIGSLTDKTELLFLVSFGFAILSFISGYINAGWFFLLLHQIVYGQILQRKLRHKPNLKGQDYLKAYLRFWLSTFLAIFSLLKGLVIFRKVSSQTY